jgi:hypothetical protein
MRDDMPNPKKNEKRKYCDDENLPNSKIGARTRRKLNPDDFEATTLMMNEFNIGIPTIGSRASKKQIPPKEDS